jgi:hypothetical protein
MLAALFGLLILALTPPPAKPKTVKDLTGDADAPSPIIQTHVLPQPSSTPKVVAPPAVLKPGNIQEQLIATFRAYVGIKEEPLGSNNGPMVDKFNASCGFSRADHAPWCASVAHYGYLQNGLQRPGAYSPSWFTKARAISRDKVVPADVALVWFASKGRYAHTIACVEKVTFSAGRVVQVITLEGNTNAQGSREGDQFARRMRPADTVQFVRWWN